MPAPAPSELERCLSEPGYTPPSRALEALLGALIAAPEEQAKPLERAIARAGGSALQAMLRVLPRCAPGERPPLFGLLVRLSGALEDAALYPVALAGLDEAHPQSRKLAARALGKLADSRAEPRLLEALQIAQGSERKSVVDALGALGNEASMERLAALTSDDVDMVRRLERARLMIERRLGRNEPGRLLLNAPLPKRWRVALSCRAGLAPVLADELREGWSPKIVSAERVDVEHTGTLNELLAARTALDLALVIPLPLPQGSAEPPGPPAVMHGGTAGASAAAIAAAQRIADSLARPETLAALGAWTQGLPRFRVSWTSGGHRRALSWALAAALRERTTALINDSQAARWTLRAPPDARGELLLVPRFEEDPRFAHRRADVPAASHPTLAAALARLAGVRADDVVWDPFVGSGLELVERARLGPLHELWGSDRDPRALAAARANLEAAGLSFARLVEADALAFSPPSPSLILTNPPMGRRVARDGSLGELLDRFLEHAARVLRPGGRLVWLSPLAGRTEAQARRLGLVVASGPNVDLGGFWAQVQICTRV